jgi:DNA-directed RNA polymerase subunit RPC12/RpoP
MKISVKCPRCNNQILLSSNAADRRITCPKCQKLFKVPAMDELDDALNAIKGTHGGVFVDEKGNRFG